MSSEAQHIECREEKTMKTRAAIILLVVLGACGTGAQADVVIETVTVGNPGNAGELSGTGAGGAGPDRVCGAVGYLYHIGRFEITAGQYAEFLNAVAATDTYDLWDLDMDLERWRGRVSRLWNIHC